MPSEYVSGKVRHSLPRTWRWSLTMLFNSPPMYWPGIRTRGSRRVMVSLRLVFIILVFLHAGLEARIEGIAHYAKSRPDRQSGAPLRGTARKRHRSRHV